MKTVSLAAIAVLLITPASAGGLLPISKQASQLESAPIGLAAFGDLPASGSRRRGGRKTRESKPSAPAEARKDVQGETAAQHKAYLKQYGF